MTGTKKNIKFREKWYSPPEQQHSNQLIITAWLSIGEQQHSNQSITMAC